MPTTNKSVVFPVRDLEKSTQLFKVLLDTEPHADTPYYVGFNVDGFEVGLNPQGHATGMTGPVNFWDVEDVNAAIASLVAAGATVVQDANEVGGGTTIAVLADLDGNVIGLRHFRV